jgi:Na+/H+ antiporter NhaA
VTETETANLTPWHRYVRAPLRTFSSSETSGAAILLASTIAALIWVNVNAHSYNAVWHTTFAIRFGTGTVNQDLRGWVNTGLMTFFFLVVGLEARREFDIGELRERKRVTLPLLAGITGMIVPVGIYLAFNGGRNSAHGWGTVMSTDTAFALGMLALVGPRFPDRLRAFMLTVVVVDDIVALLVIATFYTKHLRWMPLLIALALFACTLAIRAFKPPYRMQLYAAFGAAIWLALFKSGVDPVVVGLVLGLLTYAYSASRPALDLATEGFRQFREQPTAQLARQARASVEAAISPNDRLQQRFSPWTTYIIVPLFALANAGIPISKHFLLTAYKSPITLGIVVGYVLGKPIGIAGMSWLVTAITHRKLRPPVGWAAVAGAGSIAGIGFTVSLLIASLAFTGTQLQEAKVGVLTAAVLASLLTWILFRVTERLPTRQRIIALLGRSEAIVDLADPVDVARDHIRGPQESLVTLLEYGDLECPYCGQAEPIVRQLLSEFGDIRYVWRHLPLTEVHPNAQLAAEATEAADAQGAFWEMHDLLFQHQDALGLRDLIRYAGELGLDVDRFTDDVKHHVGAARVASDVDSADLSKVSGTPTFFINGIRHHGAYDIASLKAAVKAAGARATIASE